MSEILVATLGSEAFDTSRPYDAEIHEMMYPPFDKDYPDFRFSSISKNLDKKRFCATCSKEFCKYCIDKNAVMRDGSIGFYFPFCPKLDKIARDKIIYKNNLSMAQIKQILKKINYEYKKIKDIIINIETRLYFLHCVHNYIINNMLEDDWSIMYEGITLCQRDDFLEFYKELLKYFDNIPNLEQKYLKLLAVHKAGNQCVKCFATAGTLGIELKRKKNCMTCNVCLSKRKEDTIIMGCPICLMDFRKGIMTKTRCGNEHFMCKSCYQRMDTSTTDYGRKYTCPMCRGTL